MTQASVGVPVTPLDVGQKAIDCETFVVDGVTYHRQNVKAFLYDGAGNPLTGISDHIAGYGLFCISEPVGYQIAEGGIAGHEAYHGFGYDAGIGATLKDINGYTGNTPVPATAILMQVVSSSARTMRCV